MSTTTNAAETGESTNNIYEEVTFGGESYSIRLPLEIWSDAILALYKKASGGSSVANTGEELPADSSVNITAPILTPRELLFSQEIEVEMMIEGEALIDTWNLLTIGIFLRDKSIVRCVVASYLALMEKVFNNGGGSSSLLRINSQAAAISQKWLEGDHEETFVTCFEQGPAADAEGEAAEQMEIPFCFRSNEDIMTLPLKPLYDLIAGCHSPVANAVVADSSTADQKMKDLAWIKEAVGDLFSVSAAAATSCPIYYPLVFGDMKTNLTVRTKEEIYLIKSVMQTSVVVFGFDTDTANPAEEQEISENDLWASVSAIKFPFAVHDVNKIESAIALLCSTSSGKPTSLADILSHSPDPAVANNTLETTLFHCAILVEFLDPNPTSLGILKIVGQTCNPKFFTTALYFSAKINKPEIAATILREVCPVILREFLFRTAAGTELFVANTPRGKTVKPVDTRVDVFFQLLMTCPLHGGNTVEDLKALVESSPNWLAIAEGVMLPLVTAEKERMIAAKEDEYSDHFFETQSALTSLETAIEELKDILPSNQNKSGGGDGFKKSLPLPERFAMAQKGFGKIATKQPDSVKLQFYALFKQATVGDVNSSRPAAFDLAGRAKWDAWAALKGFAQSEAMERYCDEYSKITGGDNKHNSGCGADTRVATGSGADSSSSSPFSRRAIGTGIVSFLGWRGLIVVLGLIMILLRRMGKSGLDLILGR